MSLFRILPLATSLLLVLASARAATLVHHYPLDGNADDRLGAAPLSIRGDGVTFPDSDGAAGGHLRLAGSDDYLVATLEEGSALSVLGDYSTFRPFSVAFWVRQTPEQASSATQAVFGMTTDSDSSATYNTGFEVITRESGGGVGLRVRARQGGGGANEGEIVTGHSVSTGGWRHVVAVYEAQSRSVYVDGVFRGSNQVPVEITTNPVSRFAIGAFLRADRILDDFEGDIDDFQIYEGAITPEQARLLYLNPGATLAEIAPPEDAELVEMVDPLIGVESTGSCVPGPCLPNASIHPSPNTLAAAPGGYKAGSPVVGFAQLHPQGAGASTMSYGNFLVSPKIGGSGTTESSHASPVSGAVARAYSWRGHLDAWQTHCTVVPAEHSAIYEFEFPPSSDARIYLDVARKQNSDEGMRSGSIVIDPVAGTISGGGNFDRNWNPARYDVYFYAKIDRTPVSGGTWSGDTVTEGDFDRSRGSRGRLGGWVKLDTTADRVVRMKIAVSFVSVERARAHLEREIPGWNIAALEENARTRWANALSVLHAPGIAPDEGRKLFTALYHSLVQPRDRTGDAPGWPEDAPFWDDHYTLWDTWQTLFPLLSITHPEIVAANVNGFAERFERNGRAETAFTQGKDYQVGQGGDEVDLVAGDAWAKQIPGIDWERLWPLLEFHAGRRTEDYRNLGYASSDGNWNGYDWRARSGSSTLAFAFGDWCIAQIASGLGKPEIAASLLARSGNWRNVWDPTLVSDGFSGFVRARNRSGAFSTNSATSGSDFYQGTPWIYSFNIHHDRDEMMARMGGRARFIQRLEHALGKNSSAYIDFTNEPSFQTIPLFHHARRPYLASHWSARLRDRFGPYSFPGDEDSGAMSSLYFFLTAGFFPSAGQDFYQLHGPRVPRLEFTVDGDKTFTVLAENAGHENIHIQSASLNGQPLDVPRIRHADIVAGSTLAFTMGPHPTTWGTGSDFALPPLRELILPVRGPWIPALGNPTISGADSDSPVWGGGADGADNSAIHSPIPAVHLAHSGDTVTLAARVRFHGLADSQSAPGSRFAWGLFDANGQSGVSGWTGCLAANDTVDAADTQHLWKMPPGNSSPFHSTTAAVPLASYSLPAPDFTDGLYRVVLTLTRNAQGALDYQAALVRESDNVLLSAFTGSDLDPATFRFDHVGFRAGDAMAADSIEILDCVVVASRTDYAGRDLLIPDGGVFRWTDGPLTIATLVNDGRLAIDGGQLHVTGDLTNNGSLRVKDPGSLSVGGRLTNPGTIDRISSSGTIDADIENTGRILDIHSLQPSLTIDGPDLTITFPAYEDHVYLLQVDESRTLAGPWTNLTDAIPGTGENFHLEITDGAAEDAGFFRVVPDP